MSDRIAVFNAGRIEQVGTPAEVYERPATAFVAGFIGVSNMLERDGRRFTMRPEKIRILAPARPRTACTPSPGTVVERATSVRLRASRSSSTRAAAAGRHGSEPRDFLTRPTICAGVRYGSHGERTRHSPSAAQTHPLRRTA